MKKLFAFIIALMCCGNLVIDASAINLNIIDKENISQDYYDYNGLKLTYHSSIINNFWYTGKEYIYRDVYDGYSRYRRSDDMINWDDISETSGITEINKLSNYTYSINYWGDKYIVFNRLHELSGESISEVQYNTTINYPLLILDKDFELISKQEFEAPITGVSYVDGKYYAETKDYSQYKNSYNFEPIKKVYVSEDGILWNEDKTLSEVPIGNGMNKTLILDGEMPDGDTRYTKKIVGIAEQGNINNTTDIVFERENLKSYKVVDDLYVCWDTFDVEEKVFQISLDGVYWLDVDFPSLLTTHEIHPESTSDSVIEAIYDCIGVKDKILFQTQYRLFEYDLEDLRTAWRNACDKSQIYVKFDGVYLGFETPPIIENGSTLVPMRFLFEQMGADVEWNGETQTATATLDNTEITFSINNINAEVNNILTTMDVPARLVNGKTIVPLRFLSENMGYTVEWDADSRTAIIQE